MKIPANFHDIVDPLIGHTRQLMERGEPLAPIAFVGNLATQQMVPVPIVDPGEHAKDGLARDIQSAAKYINADFVFIVMEAWSLNKKYVARYKEILEQYGSIANCPHKESVVNFSLETHAGTWNGSARILPKPPSKKRHTFGVVNFIFADAGEGRFVGLLPRSLASCNSEFLI